MTKNIFLATGLAWLFILANFQAATALEIIPQPEKVHLLNGNFALTGNTIIIVRDDDFSSEKVGNYLAEQIKAISGKRQTVKINSKTSSSLPCGINFSILFDLFK